MRIATRRRALARSRAALALAELSLSHALAQQTLTIAAFPAVDEIGRSAIPQCKRSHPAVAIKVIGRRFADHHTAKTTALSTPFYRHDVVAPEVGYVGRFAHGGGLEDLSRPPRNVARFQSRRVPFAYQQATSRKCAVVASLPLVVRFVLSSRQRISGLTAGAAK